MSCSAANIAAQNAWPCKCKVTNSVNLFAIVSFESGVEPFTSSIVG